MNIEKSLVYAQLNRLILCDSWLVPDYELPNFRASAGKMFHEILKCSTSLVKATAPEAYLNRTLQAILAKYQIRRPNAFIQISKNYRYRNALWQLIKTLSVRAGIAPAGPHSLRHYFATRMIQKGVNIYYLSKILGHQSVQTTEKIYLHYTAEETIGLTNCLD